MNNIVIVISKKKSFSLQIWYTFFSPNMVYIYYLCLPSLAGYGKYNILRHQKIINKDLCKCTCKSWSNNRFISKGYEFQRRGLKLTTRCLGLALLPTHQLLEPCTCITSSSLTKLHGEGVHHHSGRTRWFSAKTNLPHRHGKESTKDPQMQTILGLVTLSKTPASILRGVLLQMIDIHPAQHHTINPEAAEGWRRNNDSEARLQAYLILSHQKKRYWR